MHEKQMILRTMNETTGSEMASFWGIPLETYRELNSMTRIVNLPE
jgi:hypothetical protein